MASFKLRFNEEEKELLLGMIECAYDKQESEYHDLYYQVYVDGDKRYTSLLNAAKNDLQSLKVLYYKIDNAEEAAVSLSFEDCLAADDLEF